MTPFLRRHLLRLSGFVLLLLVIEWLDEFVYGTREAAWPLVRDDLNLNYVQIGLLLTVPIWFANIIEPVLGILADVWKRRALILGGGVCFTLGLLLMGSAGNFWVLMLANMLLAPASGAFVALSQATLMDSDPERHEQNMARWTLAGSIGQTTGPLLLGLFVALGWGWRGAFLIMAVIALIVLLVAWRFSFPNGSGTDEDEESEAEPITFRQGVLNAWAALKRREVLRWLTLLTFADLMLDILLSYLALYFVDVVRVDESQAGIAVSVWLGVGLIGDVLLIPLLERVRGVSYLRFSAAAQVVLFSAFLLVEPYWLKLGILGVIGFFNAGWYSILQANLYSVMPGQSGTVLTLHNIFGFAGTALPLIIGLLAEQFGLGNAMWFILLGPVALLLGLPRRSLDRAGG